MSRLLLVCSTLLVAVLGAMPLAAQAHEGPWHVPIPVTAAGTVAKLDVIIMATLTEYRIALDPTRPRIKVGQHVRFIIANKGKLDHEFMIMSAKMASMSGMSMNWMHAMSVATVAPNRLRPGATVVLNVVFTEPGPYQIACHLPGHEAMKASVTVSA